MKRNLLSILSFLVLVLLLLLAAFDEPAAIEDNLMYQEPPDWFFSVRPTQLP